MKNVHRSFSNYWWSLQIGFYKRQNWLKQNCSEVLWQLEALTDGELKTKNPDRFQQINWNRKLYFYRPDVENMEPLRTNTSTPYVLVWQRVWRNVNAGFCCINPAGSKSPDMMNSGRVWDINPLPQSPNARETVAELVRSQSETGLSGSWIREKWWNRCCCIYAFTAT